MFDMWCLMPPVYLYDVLLLFNCYTVVLLPTSPAPILPSPTYIPTLDYKCFAYTYTLVDKLFSNNHFSLFVECETKSGICSTGGLHSCFF